MLTAATILKINFCVLNTGFLCFPSHFVNFSKNGNNFSLVVFLELVVSFSHSEEHLRTHRIYSITHPFLHEAFAVSFTENREMIARYLPKQE